MPNNGISAGRLILMAAFISACASMESQVRRNSTHIISINQNQDIPYKQNVAEQITAGERFTDAEMTPQALRTYSTDTIKLLLEGLDNVSFLTHGAQPHLSREELVFDELDRRGGAPPAAIQDLFQRLLASRQFEKASALKARFPDAKLWDLPKIIEAKDASERAFRVYDISADSKTATVMHIPVEAGPRIVISAWYSCPVAARALKYIEEDPPLAEAMRSHGMILTSRFEPGGVARRNAETAFTKTFIAYTEPDWQGVDFTSSPTFYFLKDGNPVRSFTGADTKETFTSDFLQGLESIGLRAK